MRALCGSIITAGALIGMGLLSIGLGTRYQNYTDRDGDTLQFLRLRALDTPLQIILVFLIAAALIGLAIAFVGLAQYNYRMHHEHLHRLRSGTHAESPRVTV